jgi:hypothetical protein
MLKTLRKHWIVYKKLDIFLAIHVNLPASEEKDIRYVFRQDLTKKRYYLVLEKEEPKFLILTISSKEQPTWAKFGPIKCPCLKAASYLILNTKILMTQKFAHQYGINLTKQALTHSCLTKQQLIDLPAALAVYWKQKNHKLYLIELGINKKNK